MPLNFHPVFLYPSDLESKLCIVPYTDHLCCISHWINNNKIIDCHYFFKTHGNWESPSVRTPSVS